LPPQTFVVELVVAVFFDASFFCTTDSSDFHGFLSVVICAICGEFLLGWFGFTGLFWGEKSVKHPYNNL